MTLLQTRLPEAYSRPHYMDIRLCPHCGDQLLAAEWSEYVTEGCVRHFWRCDDCSYQFATSVNLARR